MFLILTSVLLQVWVIKALTLSVVSSLYSSLLSPYLTSASILFHATVRTFRWRAKELMRPYVLWISDLARPHLVKLGKYITIQVLMICVFGLVVASVLFAPPPTLRTLLGKRYSKKMKLLLAPVLQWLTTKGHSLSNKISSWRTRRRPGISTNNGSGRAAAARKFVLAMTVIASAAAQGERNRVSQYIVSNREHYDTDSFLIGIDNRCSGCMSHKKADFLPETLNPIPGYIKGFGGARTTNVQMGTIKWSIQADDGSVTTFHIPNSYFVPSGGVRLLSPQHLSQTLNDHQPRRNGTYSTTTGDSCTLFWDQGRKQLTIPVDPANNVFTFRSAPGYARYEAYCAQFEKDSPLSEPMCYDTSVSASPDEAIPEDEIHIIPSSAADYSPRDEILEAAEWPFKPDGGTDKQPSVQGETPAAAEQASRLQREEPISFEMSEPAQTEGVQPSGGGQLILPESIKWQ